MKGQALPQDAVGPVAVGYLDGPRLAAPRLLFPCPSARACSSWRMPWLVLVGPWRTRVFALLLISYNCSRVEALPGRHAATATTCV